MFIKIGRTNNGSYEPSPEDIKRACEGIQEGWTPEERDKRYRKGSGERVPLRYKPISTDHDPILQDVVGNYNDQHDTFKL